MTPHQYLSNSIYTFFVSGNGQIDNNWTREEDGIRPVINLKADVIITGSGTTSNPYQVE